MKIILICPQTDLLKDETKIGFKESNRAQEKSGLYVVVTEHSGSYSAEPEQALRPSAWMPTIQLAAQPCTLDS